MLYKLLKEIDRYKKRKEDILKEKNLRENFAKIGKGVTFDSSSIINSPHKIKIGNYVNIGPEAYIWATGGLSIGNNVYIATRVHLHTSNHIYENALAIPFDHRSIIKPVIIGDNCWIGAGVTIVPGVELGEGCIVGMGSVVTKSFPPCSIIGGNPAKLIKMRDINHYNQLKEKGMFFNQLEKERKINYKMLSSDEEISKENEIIFLD
jgi:maltose O-acetyltransferase